MAAPSDIGFFDSLVLDLTSGKGQLRFVIQPIVAILLGARLGVADAHEGRQPFLLRLLKAGHDRAKLFKDSLSDVVLPLCIGMLIDGILQHYVIGHVRPLQAVLVGMMLVWLPYSVSRALTHRIVHHRSLRRAAG